MNREEARGVIFETLRQIAPEADPTILDPKLEFREQLDIDSMDFLNFIIGLDERTGVEVPETDYETLETLDKCIEYLVSHAPSGPPAVAATAPAGNP